MSLQVWLPLNGNLKNQGCKGNSFSNSNTSYITSVSGGKVTSNCYNFNSSANNNGINASDNGFMADCINNKSWSLCAWINTSSTETIVMSLSYGLMLFAGTSNKARITLYNSSRTVNCYSSVAVNDGKWHHIVASYDVSTNAISFYVDGVVTGTTTYTSGYTYSSSWTNGLFIGRNPNNNTVNDYYLYKGKLNDVRIYNHCLSVKEVKKLAKGLMVHYTLSRPCDNLAKNTYLNRVTTPLYSVGDTTYGRNRITILDEGKQNSTTYTISAKVKTNGNRNIALYYYEANWTGGYGTNTGWQTTNGEWKIIKASFTTKSDQSSKTIYMEFYSQTSTTDGEAYVEWFKLEKGNKATPWIPNSADTLYSALGLNSTTESDVTGYGNDGTRVNITTRESDTPRYLSCIYFNGTGTRINLPAITFTGASNSYTFSWWSKSGSSGMFWGFSNGNRLNLYMSTNLYWNTGDGANNPFYSSGTTVIPATTYGNNVWHHYAITGDGTTVTLYVDGNKAGTAKTYKGITGTQIYINGWDTGTSYKFNGRMSDFRIYATALSAEDILELYHTSASIDKKGNMHCYELVEV